MTKSGRITQTLQARERCVQCIWSRNTGERPLGRHRQRWKGIKMDNKEI